MKYIKVLFVADPKVLPDFFSTIDSIFFYKDKEVVNELNEIVLC